MNKRTVKEILIGLVLGCSFGALTLLEQVSSHNFAMVVFNGPALLGGILLNSEFAFSVLTVIYWGYLGVMFTVLIDLKKSKLLFFVVVALVVLHSIVFYILGRMLSGI
jgi:hypothetical protein